MKLQNYIIEQRADQEVMKKGLEYYIPKIKKECKPFINDIRGAAGTIFRNDTKNRDKPIWKKMTRKDRRPLDTSIEIHNAVDKLFKKEYGWSARSEGLFCYAMTFNNLHLTGKWLVFPAGNYEYVWSPEVDDLWAVLGDHNQNDEHAIGAIISAFKDSFLPTYKSDKLKMATKTNNEVMVRCDYSYLCRLELIEPLNEALDLKWHFPKIGFRKI